MYRHVFAAALMSVAASFPALAEDMHKMDEAPAAAARHSAKHQAAGNQRASRHERMMKRWQELCDKGNKKACAKAEQSDRKHPADRKHKA